MRITCPSCSAQYEVPNDAIPDEGRDVQCSNCSTTWFQVSAETLAKAEAATQAPRDEDLAPPASDTSENQDHDAAEQNEEAAASPPRRELDPEIVDILRQEADRETSLRSAENTDAAEEVQEPEDASFHDAAQSSEDLLRQEQAQQRMARLHGQTQPNSSATSDTERENLPDVDDINASFDDSAQARENGFVDADGEMHPPKRKSGFTRGFALALLVLAIAVLVYINAPAIAQQVPPTNPYLNSYVDWVDGMRIWLDEQLKIYLPAGPKA